MFMVIGKNLIRNNNLLILLLMVVIGSMITLAGCGGGSDGDDSPQASTTLSFESVPVPVTDEQKREILASSSVTVTETTSTAALTPGDSYDIGYNIIARSGDNIGGTIFGRILDQTGNPVLNSDASDFISNDNDFSSLLTVGSKLFNISHFESRPGAMYLTELSQDGTTGALTPVSTANIDFSAFGGLWVPCAGSVTPWGNHLGSEEYPPNARAIEEATTPDDINGYYKPMLRYFGIVDPFDASVTIDDIKNNFKPYRYGYPVEVAVAEDGTPTVNKRYAMGRMALELAYVMPDQKTVYMSDDGTNVGLFMFVADTAGDLSAGRLYAAKWHQVGADNGGTADLTWIDLGHATQSQVRTAVSDTVFSDIFDTSEPDADGSCAEGFTSTNTTDGLECLALKKDMELLASRLETRRYAALLGATTEFRKEEGITFDAANMKLYVAMSEVAKGMEDLKKNGSDNDKYDLGGSNDVKLPYNKCGTVFGLDVAADETIGSDYVARNMYGVVSGTMTDYPAGSDYENNTCDVDGIANPDNLTMIPGYNTLIIGEDTGRGHQNDAIWAYNLVSGELTRIQTTPYGSETTSPYFYPNIGGFGYLMSVVQHPYGESDQDQIVDASDARGYVGFIGPFPAMD
jgi:secreted PhoX family phosphatase